MQTIQSSYTGIAEEYILHDDNEKKFQLHKCDASDGRRSRVSKIYPSYTRPERVSNEQDIHIVYAQCKYAHNECQSAHVSADTVICRLIYIYNRYKMHCVRPRVIVRTTAFVASRGETETKHNL